MSDYSIWVMEYAAVEQFPVDVMLYLHRDMGTRKLPYAFGLLKRADQVIMIDCPYNHADHGKALAESYGVTNWHSPADVLAECGLTPSDVTAVFITHAHFDHIGTMDRFPNATFYIQKRELDQWIWALELGPQFSFLVSAVDPADIMRALELAKQGRLVCIDGDRENVLPGIDVHLSADTHTYGSMYVHIRNDGAANSQDGWVFAGDNIYTYDNLTGLDPEAPQIVPIGLAVGSQNNLMFATDEMLKAVGGEHRRLVPIHEDRLHKVFPSRLTDRGLQVVELALASDEPSRVS